MYRILKVLFFALVVKPFVLIGLGLNLIGRHLLPRQGPAVIAANHNSHLDTLVLMSLFPLTKVHLIRPVAAADYFLANRFRAWFSQKIIGIIPLDRSGGTDMEVLFEPCVQALDRGEILILFPEGSRGEPEQMGRVRKGVAQLLKGRDDVPVTPVVMHGLGRALPRGEALLVPFNCDVVVGTPLHVTGRASQFTKELTQSFDELFEHCFNAEREGLDQFETQQVKSVRLNSLGNAHILL